MNNIEILRTSDEDILKKTLQEISNNLSIDNVLQTNDTLHLKVLYGHKDRDAIAYQLLAELQGKTIDKKSVRRVTPEKKRRKKINNTHRIIETVGVEVLVLATMNPSKTYDGYIDTTWTVFDSYCPLMWENNKPVLDTEQIPLSRKELELYAVTNLALRINGKLYALSEHGLLSLARKIDAVTAFPKDASTDELIAMGFMLATKLNAYPLLSLLVTNTSAKVNVIQGVAEARYQIIRQDDLLDAIITKAQKELGVIPKVLGSEVSVTNTLIDLELVSMRVSDVKMGIRIQNSDLGDQALSVTLTATINGAMGYLITNKQVHVATLSEAMVDKLFAGFKEQYESFNKMSVGTPILTKSLYKEFYEILGKKRMNAVQLQVGSNTDFYKKMAEVRVSAGKWQWKLGNAIGEVMLNGQKIVNKKGA